jgi:hypothetical protein
MEAVASALEASRPTAPELLLLPLLELPVPPPLLELVAGLDPLLPLDTPPELPLPVDAPVTPEEELAAPKPPFPWPESSPQPWGSAEPGAPLQPAATRIAASRPNAATFEDQARIDVLLPQTVAHRLGDGQRKGPAAAGMPLPLIKQQPYCNAVPPAPSHQPVLYSTRSVATTPK